MVWWLWILLGLVLLGLELLTPGGFFIVFFGIAAVVVGTLVGLEAAGPVWVQWLLFSLLSVASLALFRGKLQARLAQGLRQGAPIDEIAGQTAVLLEDLPAGGVGKAELRGAVWTCRSATGDAMAKGGRCVVERMDGLTLWVRSE